MLLDDLSRLFSRDYSSRDLEDVKKKKKKGGGRGGFKTPRKHGPIKGYGPLGKRENCAAYASACVRLLIGRASPLARPCNLFASLVAERV